MPNSPKVYSDDEQVRRLQHQLEHKIRVLNQETISRATGRITMADYTAVARMVSNLRACYLKAAIDLGKGNPDECITLQHTKELRDLREAYQEALQGFEALEHALRRGYISLQG